jgi:hypothetical protein
MLQSLKIGFVYPTLLVFCVKHRLDAFYTMVLEPASVALERCSIVVLSLLSQAVKGLNLCPIPV